MANNNTPVQSVFNMTLSKKGPIAIPEQVDLQTESSIEYDATYLVQQDAIDFISGVYVDNSANTEVLSIRCNQTNQLVSFPAGAQGYMPLLATGFPKFIISCPVSPGIIIPITFYNIPLLPYMWTPENGGATSVVITNPLPLPVSSTVTITDGSIIMAGGDEEVVIAGDASGYLLIQNPTGNSPVTVNIAGGDASVSGFVLTAGGQYENTSGISNAVHISGTATENLIVFVGSAV